MAKGQLGDVLQHIRTLVGADSAGALADGELLERFVRHHDEEAFAALVQRHGPLVLGVCRRVLGHVHDAEDACQATFLVLARRAGSIRKKDSVGSWLHGVAYRAASSLRRELARRHAHERPVVDVAQAEGGEATWREVRTVLDEELRRLPERLRAPLLLCYLEGKTRDEAALALGWSLGTLRGRLERGRQLLRARLTRRGLTLSAALLAGLLAENAAPAALPAALTVRVIQAAALARAGQAAATGIISARVVAVAEGVMQAMWWTKLKGAAVGVLTLLSLIGLGAGVLTTGLLPARQPAAEEAASPPAPPAAGGKKAGSEARPTPGQGQPADPARLARNQAESRINLKQLALAMHNYNDAHGHLPAPAIYAGQGGVPGGAPGGAGAGGFGGGMPGGMGAGLGRSGMSAMMGKMSTPGIPGGGAAGMAGAMGAGAKPQHGKGPGGPTPGVPGAPMMPGLPPGAGAPGIMGGGMGMMAGMAGMAASPPGGMVPALGGKALLSWRVAILPYVGEDALYREFKLDEPWDGPHNKKLLKRMPRIYAPPGVRTREPYSTFYQVFVGKHAAFETHQQAQLPASFPDGTSNTLLIVEADRAVPWTKPEDLHFDPDEPLPALGGLFPDVFYAAFADGSVHALSKKADPELLRKAIMRDDGQPINFDRLHAPASRREAELWRKSERLRKEAVQLREQLEELRREKQVLEEEDAWSTRQRQANERLEQFVRQSWREVEQLKQEIEQLKRAREKRTGGKEEK